MTTFLDVRYQPVGGGLAGQVNLNQTTDAGDYVSLSADEFESRIRGRNVLIAAHGYNVSRADGIESLSNWASLVASHFAADEPFAFVGLLWPGDSVWAHGLDYPDEPKIADEAGALIGPFVDANFQDAASVSFASHSLGARVVLATIKNMTQKVRRLTLMAGAIDDNCLSTEFADAAANVEVISALASKKDTVLSHLYPLGNFVAGIIDEGHPWWRAAIGHHGPAKNHRPSNFRSPFMLPDDWDFNHGNYLQVDQTPVPALAPPYDVPPQDTPEPASGATGWQEAFTAAFESDRFR
jgi:hypothetical protein